MKQLHDHPFPPIFDENSKVLILGTFPSVKSREQNFYYAHPQNRFWKVIAALVAEEIPDSPDEKAAILLRHKIALWDTVSSCEIENSSDASISKVIPNDISTLLKCTNISLICCNGKKAHELYRRHIEPSIGLPAISLPSTSPANASSSLGMLISIYSEVIGPYLAQT